MSKALTTMWLNSHVNSTHYYHYNLDNSTQDMDYQKSTSIPNWQQHLQSNATTSHHPTNLSQHPKWPYASGHIILYHTGTYNGKDYLSHPTLGEYLPQPHHKLPESSKSMRQIKNMRHLKLFQTMPSQPTNLNELTKIFYVHLNWPLYIHGMGLSYCCLQWDLR